MKNACTDEVRRWRFSQLVMLEDSGIQVKAVQLRCLLEKGTFQIYYLILLLAIIPSWAFYDELTRWIAFWLRRFQVGGIHSQ